MHGPMMNTEINTNTPLDIQSEAPIDWEQQYKQSWRCVVTGSPLVRWDQQIATGGGTEGKKRETKTSEENRATD